jgi:hypothetical protein
MWGSDGRFPRGPALMTPLFRARDGLAAGGEPMLQVR